MLLFTYHFGCRCLLRCQPALLPGHHKVGDVDHQRSEDDRENRGGQPGGQEGAGHRTRDEGAREQQAELEIGHMAADIDAGGCAGVDHDGYQAAADGVLYGQAQRQGKHGHDDKASAYAQHRAQQAGREAGTGQYPDIDVGWHSERKDSTFHHVIARCYTCAGI